MNWRSPVAKKGRNVAVGRSADDDAFAEMVNHPLPGLVGPLSHLEHGKPDPQSPRVHQLILGDEGQSNVYRHSRRRRFRIA